MRTYRTYFTEQLRPVVKQVTVIQETDPSPRVNSIPYFADGLPGIYFQQSAYDLFLNRGMQRLSKLFLYGQTVKPITIDTVGPYTVIVLQLYPPAIKTLFGIDAHELTDTCIDYEYLTGTGGSSLKNRMLEENSAENQIKILQDALLKLFYEVQSSVKGGIYYASERIIRSGGLISLSSLYNDLNISERTFQRRFLREVGVAPSQFKNIIRFHMALNCLESNSESLSQIAYRHGFSDQSHFIRIFKEFTGYTPTEYKVSFNIGNPAPQPERP